MDNDLMFRVQEQYGFSVEWNGEWHYLASKVVPLGVDTKMVLQIMESHDHPEMVQLYSQVMRGSKIVSTSWQYLEVLP